MFMYKNWRLLVEFPCPIRVQFANETFPELEQLRSFIDEEKLISFCLKKKNKHSFAFLNKKVSVQFLKEEKHVPSLMKIEKMILSLSWARRSSFLQLREQKTLPLPFEARKWFVSFPKWGKLCYFSWREQINLFHEEWGKNRPLFLLPNEKNFAPVFKRGKTLPLFPGKRKIMSYVLVHFSMRRTQFFSTNENYVLLF